MYLPVVDETRYEPYDVLVAGGGMAGTGILESEATAMLQSSPTLF